MYFQCDVQICCKKWFKCPTQNRFIHVNLDVRKSVYKNLLHSAEVPYMKSSIV
jgi:hypothetical protein